MCRGLLLEDKDGTYSISLQLPVLSPYAVASPHEFVKLITCAMVYKFVPYV